MGIGVSQAENKQMTDTSNSGCLSLIATLIFGPQKSQELSNEKLPYQLRNTLLSAAEFSFYKVLEDAVKNKLKIQCKVRLADIFYTSYGTNIYHFNRITGKHVDFLLCDMQTMRPILGIELDDSSHSQPDRKARDIFVDEVFKVAQLPLLHIQAKRAYSPEVLLVQIKQLVEVEL
jgi:hypothetical protein